MRIDMTDEARSFVKWSDCHQSGRSRFWLLFEKISYSNVPISKPEDQSEIETFIFEHLPTESFLENNGKSMSSQDTSHEENVFTKRIFGSVRICSLAQVENKSHVFISWCG